ncbi:MAG: hypothetical protein U5L09_02955 [Bacteroidales bacterium]|nr:hypothetical protein [Bacteroidales bacterium]
MRTGRSLSGQRISAINEISRKRNQQREEYHRLIASADSAFSNERLEEARSHYQEAVAMFADSAYPKKQLAAIDSRIASQQNAASNTTRLSLKRMTLLIMKTTSRRWPPTAKRSGGTGRSLSRATHLSHQ